jgi:hypothetical protein
MLRKMIFAAGMGYVARRFMGGRRGLGSPRSGFGFPMRRRSMTGF